MLLLHIQYVSGSILDDDAVNKAYLSKLESFSFVIVHISL